MDKQKVNAFTSPHLIKITERILIDNKFVDDEVFVRTFDSLLAKLNQEEIVFFEFMTACALFYLIKTRQIGIFLKLVWAENMMRQIPYQ